MKKDIHPKYNTKATVTCACGAKFDVSSTVDKTEIEICSRCHPFYTGQKKLVDTAGRVQKFKNRLEKTAGIKSKKPTLNKAVKRRKKTNQKTKNPSEGKNKK